MPQHSAITASLINALTWQASASAISNPRKDAPLNSERNIIRAIRSADQIGIQRDTQMMLYAFDTIAEVYEIDGVVTIGTIADRLKSSYNNWRCTQIQHSPHYYNTGLSLYQSMYDIKSPDREMMTVVRALPFCQFPSPIYSTFDANLTHTNEQGFYTALAQHSYMRDLLLGKWPTFTSEGTSIEQVYGDGGWTAHDCWTLGKWAFENSEGDYEKMLTLSINHKGNTGGTSAVAASLFGLAYPDIAPPMYPRLLEQDAIEHVIGRMLDINNKKRKPSAME